MKATGCDGNFCPARKLAKCPSALPAI